MATTTAAAERGLCQIDLYELDDEWTEEQKAIIETCRRFVDDEVMPDINKYHQVEELPPNIYEKVGALGVLEMLAAGELDPVTYGLVCREMERGSKFEPVVDEALLALKAGVKAFGPRRRFAEAIPPRLEEGRAGAVPFGWRRHGLAVVDEKRAQAELGDRQAGVRLLHQGTPIDLGGGGRSGPGGGDRRARRRSAGLGGQGQGDDTPESGASAGSRARLGARGRGAWARRWRKRRTTRRRRFRRAGSKWSRSPRAMTSARSSRTSR